MHTGVNEDPMYDLQRFRDAQDRGTDGLADALAELGSGRKQGHWIWYVFPQLAGLGTSSTSQRYGLQGRAEAEAYLLDDQLRERYAQALAAVSTQLCRLQPPQLEHLMGSRVDALKLVSSLTLFEQVASDLADRDDEEESAYLRLAEEIGGVLAVADAQGYGRCRKTQDQCAATGEPTPEAAER